MTRHYSVLKFQRMRERGERIAMLTAYDYPTARFADEAGIPLILVGDSLGNVVLGYDSTVFVTMEDMLHHTKAVVRGTRRALVIGDMPFMSYQKNPDDARTLTLDKSSNNNRCSCWSTRLVVLLE